MLVDDKSLLALCAMIHELAAPELEHCLVLSPNSVDYWRFLEAFEEPVEDDEINFECSEYFVCG